MGNMYSSPFSPGPKHSEIWCLKRTHRVRYYAPWESPTSQKTKWDRKHSSPKKASFFITNKSSNKHVQHILCAIHCFKHFTYVNPFNVHKYSIIIPIMNCEDIKQCAQLVRGKVRIQTLLAPESVFLPIAHTASPSLLPFSPLSILYLNP